MSLRQFIEARGSADRALALVNRAQPKQLQSMLAGAFERQPVPVTEERVEAYEDDTVLLVDGDATVIAESPLDAVAESLLFTNSDAYITGSTSLEESELPDVLSGLEDVLFRLRGYPDSHKEKLLLIGVSRHIERIAWHNDSGTLRSSFQRLSRIRDEVGTERVYRRLGDSGVDVHVYGSGATDDIPADIDVTVHVGDGVDYRDSWFVVYNPTNGDDEAIALLALQDKSGVWDGFFTSDPDEVQALDHYVATQL